MNREQIKEKYKGMFGVFSHDMYGFAPKENAKGFIAAFGSYKDALNCASKESANTAIHIIV